MVDQIIPTTPCPCFTCESLQQELIENCGAQLNILICCCGSLIETLGITGPVTLLEVGPDKVRVAGPTPLFTNELIIPLNRIAGFVELAPPLTEGNCNCASCRTFAEEVADLCGTVVAVQTCICGMNTLFFGPPNFTLVEASPDFIELRNTSGITQGVGPITLEPNQDIVIPLSEVCYVQGLFIR